MKIRWPLLVLPFVAVAARAATPAEGYPIQCQEDPATLQQFCFAPSKLAVKGSIRTSPLYVGKGTSLDRTAVAAVADCRRQTLSLKDAQGAVADLAPAPSAQVGKSLVADMCAAKLPARGATAGKSAQK